MPLSIPWLRRFDQRAKEDEIMDNPSTPPDEFARALNDIQWVNRYLNGSSLLIQQVSFIIDTHPTQAHYKILDLGCGSADIPLALARWAKNKGISIHITAVDISPTAIAYGRELTTLYPNIFMKQGDALAFDEPDGSFDIVTSSMFMHHLNNSQAAKLMAEMHRLSRLGWIINDLERHIMAWAGIILLGKLTGKGRLFMHDGPLSVRKGFTLSDLLHLERDAIKLAGQDFGRVKIMRQWPYRLIVLAVK